MGKNNPVSRRVRIGSVGVDSGQLMVVDPCYIKSDFEVDYDEQEIAKIQAGSPAEVPLNYNGACAVTLADSSAGSMMHGLAVAFSSGYGDGVYPVYATYNDDGRIVKVEIEMGFDDEDEEDDF
jgi:hypothetical protein